VAQIHVRVSFNAPEYTTDITATGTVRLLEVIREVGIQPRFYHASSSEMFGLSGKVEMARDTQTPPSLLRVKGLAFWRPRSKVSERLLVSEKRVGFGKFCDV
jgi:GDPmannose 4,6-dehydratase